MKELASLEDLDRELADTGTPLVLFKHSTA